MSSWRIRQQAPMPLTDVFARHSELGGNLGERDAWLPELLQQPRICAFAITVLEQRDPSSIDV
jgi:hypothetical protein